MVGGGVAGAVAGVAGPLGGTVASGLLGASSSGFTAIATTAVINGIGGAAGATAQSYIGQGRAPTATDLVIGAGASAFGGAVGDAFFPMTGVSTLAQARYFTPRTLGSLVSNGKNITAFYRATVTGGFVGLGFQFGLETIPSGRK